MILCSYYREVIPSVNYAPAESSTPCAHRQMPARTSRVASLVARVQRRHRTTVDISQLRAFHIVVKYCAHCSHNTTAAVAAITRHGLSSHTLVHALLAITLTSHTLRHIGHIRRRQKKHTVIHTRPLHSSSAIHQNASRVPSRFLPLSFACRAPFLFVISAPQCDALRSTTPFRPRVLPS